MATVILVILVNAFTFSRENSPWPSAHHLNSLTKIIFTLNLLSTLMLYNIWLPETVSDVPLAGALTSSLTGSIRNPNTSSWGLTSASQPHTIPCFRTIPLLWLHHIQIHKLDLVSIHKFILLNAPPTNPPITIFFRLWHIKITTRKISTESCFPGRFRLLITASELINSVQTPNPQLNFFTHITNHLYSTAVHGRHSWSSHWVKGLVSPWLNLTKSRGLPRFQNE